jgi:hypothetical protein
LTRSQYRADCDAENTIWDNEIVKRVWILIDFDPKRPSGISSTDAGQEAARDWARRCRDILREQGWPEPISADSGGAAHLRYRFDLASATEITDLIMRSLFESSTADYHRPGPEG